MKAWQMFFLVLFFLSLVYVGEALITTTSPPSNLLKNDTGSIGGGLLTAATCTSGTTTIVGARNATSVVHATPLTYPGDGTVWEAYVSNDNIVVVKVCVIAALTPISSVYHVELLS